jgi:aryl-alcohol dehydrogenase-like predicted oxidoreductase
MFTEGNWLSKRPELRSRLIIATKVWGPMDKNDPNARGLSRHHIMGAVEQSLQRLQTDYIDLYQVTTYTLYLCTSSNLWLGVTIKINGTQISTMVVVTMLTY